MINICLNAMLWVERFLCFDCLYSSDARECPFYIIYCRPFLFSSFNLICSMFIFKILFSFLSCAKRFMIPFGSYCILYSSIITVFWELLISATQFVTAELDCSDIIVRRLKRVTASIIHLFSCLSFGRLTV